jgi:aminotransferase EvaB
MSAIKTFDYLKSFATIENDIADAIQRVLKSGHLLLGPETEAFEHEFAEFVGARYCVGVSSGTTALHLALMALNLGRDDEVITVSNTCVPTIAAIELCGANPVLIDVSDYDLMIDPDLIADAITNKTKCIVPVHLWGQSVEISRIREIAERYGLSLVEDCSQAHGTSYNGRHVGTFGDAGCFSFYPTKNLGAYGDAGAIITNDGEFAARLRRMRMYGYDKNNCSIEKGMNARISEIQAAILRVKLQVLPKWLERRREIAAIYDEKIRLSNIRLPLRHPDRKHSFHQYVIRCQDRNRITEMLKSRDVSFGIHYPVPVHLMPAYRRLLQGKMPVTERASNEILSLPIHESLIDEEAGKVALAVSATA